MDSGEGFTLLVIAGVAAVGGWAAMKYLNPGAQKIEDKSKEPVGYQGNNNGPPTKTKGEDCADWKKRMNDAENALGNAQSRLKAVLNQAQGVCQDFSEEGNVFGGNNWADSKEKQSCLDYIKTGSFIAACGNCQKLQGSRNASQMRSLQQSYEGYKQQVDSFQRTYTAAKSKVDQYTDQDILC
jgi:hypothetical protein